MQEQFTPGPLGGLVTFDEMIRETMGIHGHGPPHQQQPTVHSHLKSVAVYHNALLLVLLEW